MGSNTLTSESAISSGFRKADKLEPYIWLDSDQIEKSFFVQTVIGLTRMRLVLQMLHQCRFAALPRHQWKNSAVVVAVAPVVPSAEEMLALVVGKRRWQAVETCCSESAQLRLLLRMVHRSLAVVRPLSHLSVAEPIQTSLYSAMRSHLQTSLAMLLLLFV